MLGTSIEPHERAALLAGGRPSGARRVDAGRAVCACFAVCVTTLRDAIRVQCLVAAGLPPATPAAAIENATRADERVCRGTLSDIAARVAGTASPDR